MKPKTPDIGLLDEIVAPRVLEAMRAAAAEYERLGIRYALVGGLAVGAQGWPRATKDVDFLVDDAAFERRQGGLVLLRVPFEAHGVPIDSLAPRDDEPFLGTARDVATVTGGIPVIGIEALVYMKLRAGRMRDQVDVVELLKAGADADACQTWLLEHSPELCSDLQRLVETARAEG